MKKETMAIDRPDLRRRAEEALLEKTATSPAPGEEPQKLLQELQVHQIELEMQNEELLYARNEMEAALERYSDLYDFAPVGYATLDERGIIRSINLTAAGLLGMERSQLIGRRFGLFVGSSSILSFIGEAMASPGKITCEMTLRESSEKPRIIRVEALACTAALECQVAIIDITERKRIQEEIRQLNAKLERRAYELEIANEDLEAFNYTVSHDLRSPLTIINGYCQMVQRLCGSRLDEECRGFLQEIEQGIKRMNGLIGTLLNFSSLTRSELRPESVDLSEMAKKVALELGKEQPERRVTFSIAPGVRVQGDPKLLRVVLENLFGNAWKYTGQMEDAVIEFGVTEAAGRNLYFVRDNGPGFDSAHADLLFKAFQRLPGGEEVKGFGVGLATVQRIVQLHGGRTWAEGELGKGATFFFTLG
ncbi:MAG: PAS domain-containing sensor histidine kinase [Desulfuromonadales bacterium]|nr:PAS domain-containing sensor histidine kinase [Desulfuromonadales bacterium]